MGLTDVMDGMGSQEVPDNGLLSEATSGITEFAGILISVLIYVFFALMALTTAIDLLYIVFPPIRKILCPTDSSQGNDIPTQGQQGQVQGQTKPKKCWITNELKRIMQTTPLNNKKTIIQRYFNARIISIVSAVVVMILLVSTSIFTDTGLNIGKALLNFLGF
jgi:hypothetical protein